MVSSDIIQKLKQFYEPHKILVSFWMKSFLSLNPSYSFFFKDIFDLTNIFMPKIN